MMTSTSHLHQGRKYHNYTVPQSHHTHSVGKSWFSSDFLLKYIFWLWCFMRIFLTFHRSKTNILITHLCQSVQSSCHVCGQTLLLCWLLWLARHPYYLFRAVFIVIFFVYILFYMKGNAANCVTSFHPRRQSRLFTVKFKTVVLFSQEHRAHHECRWRDTWRATWPNS